MTYFLEPRIKLVGGRNQFVGICLDSFIHDSLSLCSVCVEVRCFLPNNSNDNFFYILVIPVCLDKYAITLYYVIHLKSIA